MRIGNIDLGERPLFLAPMEDVTDIGFRHLCKRYGAAMVYTEFVSAEALVRSIKSTVSKLTISDEERPVGIQIYGRTVEDMVEAARIVEQAKPDVIDLNFGCPVKKVAGKGAGAGMLQNVRPYCPTPPFLCATWPRRQEKPSLFHQRTLFPECCPLQKRGKTTLSCGFSYSSFFLSLFHAAYTCTIL